MRFFLFLACLFFPLTAFAQAIPGQYVIKYKNGIAGNSETKARTLRSQNATLIQTLPILGISHIQISGSESQQGQRLRNLISSPEIDYIEPVYRVGALSTPNELLYTLGAMWGLDNTGQYGALNNIDIDAKEAWALSTGSTSVIVAVIDTGIKHNHPDLKDNIWINPGEIPGNGIDDDGNGFVDDVHGYDFHNNDGDPMDDNFHGTHVAGTIGASGGNSKGVVGVSWKTKLMGLKMLDAAGAGDTLNGLRAIEYVISMKRRGHNIRVINNSWGGGDYMQSMRDAIALAASEGIITVCAAGNDGTDNDQGPIYPASYEVPDMLTVAAINPLGQLSSFSNFGRNSVDIGAPGSLIWSTIIFDYYFFSDGTSMAAPHIAGIAALLASHQPGLTPKQIRDRILKTAKPLSSLDGKLVSPGIASAYHALNNSVPPAITVSSTTQSTHSSIYELLAQTLFGLFDSDKDGVSDQQELVDGTNRFDRGSFRTNLQKTVFTKYNTFFSQWNFLELIPNGTKDFNATLTVYDISGNVLKRATVPLKAGIQRDISIHDIVGKPNTFGLVQIDYPKSSDVSLIGRMSHYLPNPDGKTYSFAFVRELRNATTGTTFATSNSIDPQNRGYLVANWAEILNLDAFTQRFTFNIYNQQGRKLHGEQVSVPPLAEVDVQAGHQFGEGVYLVEVIPFNKNAKYLSAISRYSSNALPGSTGADYTFAFSLDARAGTGEQQLMPTTNQSGNCWIQTNWVEVVNVSNKTVGGALLFRNQSGAVKEQHGFTLAPKSQKHFFATSSLSVGEVGSAELLGDSAESLLSQSLVYFHDCGGGALQTAFVAPAQVPVLGNLTGSSNTYLGMSNQMILAAAPDGIEGQSVRLFNANKVEIQRPFVSGSEWVTKINLNQYSDVNTYSTVIVRPGISQKVVGINVRLREVNGKVDFAMPSMVR